MFSSIRNDCKAQNTGADLNGSTFRGKAVEETPPDVDRMPVTMNELIIFSNGKVTGELMKKYSVNDCSYTSFVDERRMIAVKVVRFNAECEGVYEGKKVTLNITGDIYADLRMSAEVSVKIIDNPEILFHITAEAE